MHHESQTVTPDDAELGARVRALRERSGLSLREVARRLDISASAVSQIERGTLQPSVSRLLAIVDVLGVGFADLFDREADTAPTEPVPAHGFTIARAAESAPMELADGVTFRRLAPRHNPDLDFFESVYPPKSVGSEAKRLVAHSGYEIGTVTEGELTVTFEHEKVSLAAGDSITFACDQPHVISNESDQTAVATWLIVHR